MRRLGSSMSLPAPQQDSFGEWLKSTPPRCSDAPHCCTPQVQLCQLHTSGGGGLVQVLFTQLPALHVPWQQACPIAPHGPAGTTAISLAFTCRPFQRTTICRLFALNM